MIIAIPTRGRVGHSAQITLREIQSMGGQWIHNTKLICPPDEVAAHKEYIYPAEVVSCPVEGIGHVRQWITETYRDQFVLMLDDDMYFSERVAPDDVKLKRCENLAPMFQWVLDTLTYGYPLVGISARQGNNRVMPDFRDVTRQNNIHGIVPAVLLEEGIKWSDSHLTEDFHVTLSLLERGYPNRVAYQWCWNQRGSGTAGGCSLYRDEKAQAASCENLRCLHNHVVNIVKKHSLSRWEGLEWRTDVNIQWRKAWRSRLEDRKRPSGHGYQALENPVLQTNDGSPSKENE